MVNWQAFIHRLDKYPPGVHEVQPPCPQSQLQEVQREIGPMPEDLVNMLQTFNGARLFIAGMELVNILGLSRSDEWTDPAVCLETLTTRWRTMTNLTNDWVLATMNYGSMVVLKHNLAVREWDPADACWIGETYDLEGWVNWIFTEGDTYLAVE